MQQTQVEDFEMETQSKKLGDLNIGDYFALPYSYWRDEYIAYQVIEKNPNDNYLRCCSINTHFIENISKQKHVYLLISNPNFYVLK